MKFNRYYLFGILAFIFYAVLFPIKYISQGESGTKRTYSKNILGFYYGNLLEYDSIGNVIRKATLKRGHILHGPDSTFYSNGVINEIFNWEESLQTGIYKKFYNDGSLEAIGYWERGLRKDSTYIYFKNGNIKEIQYFNEKGEFEGTFKKYNSNGLLNGIINFSKGEAIIAFKNQIDSTIRVIYPLFNRYLRLDSKFKFHKVYSINSISFTDEMNRKFTFSFLPSHLAINDVLQEGIKDGFKLYDKKHSLDRNRDLYIFYNKNNDEQYGYFYFLKDKGDVISINHFSKEKWNVEKAFNWADINFGNLTNTD